MAFYCGLKVRCHERTCLFLVESKVANPISFIISNSSAFVWFSIWLELVIVVPAKKEFSFRFSFSRSFSRSTSQSWIEMRDRLSSRVVVFVVEWGPETAVQVKRPTFSLGLWIRQCFCNKCKQISMFFSCLCFIVLH